MAQRKRRIRPVLVHYGAGEPVPAKYRAQNASRAAHRKRASSSAQMGVARVAVNMNLRGRAKLLSFLLGRRVWRVERYLSRCRA